MMSKSFLLKTSFLVVGLAAVLTLIIVATRINFSSAATGVPQRQTFLEQFVISGGFIVWFVLLPMSLIMVS